MLSFSSLNEEATISGITLSGNAIERLAQYMEQMGLDFIEKVGLVHRKSVFQILIRILRLCPVETGRLRGSWTPFMESNGFSSYLKYMNLPSINPGAHKKASEVREAYNDELAAEGRALGEFVDAFLNTSVSSNVVYASIVNEKQGYLTAALIWGDNQYQRNMELLLEATAREEAVTDPIPADDDGQAGA